MLLFVYVITDAFDVICWCPVLFNTFSSNSVSNVSQGYDQISACYAFVQWWEIAKKITLKEAVCLYIWFKNKKNKKKILLSFLFYFCFCILNLNIYTKLQQKGHKTNDESESAAVGTST